MNLKVGDKVVVIAGASKGKEGKITKTLKKENRVIVEGCNIVKKHRKGNGQESGGILEQEAPIHASNVMLIDPKTKKRTRIGHAIENDKKVRIAKKSSEKID
jgi:large subunit ribosomal protein L24